MMLDYEYNTPNAASLAQALRAFGYDIRTAVADLIDNSITASARNIAITFEWNNGKPWIAIADDGHGMTEDELINAMRPGSKNPLDERSEKDLGRFGLGLKTASLSQCRKFTVVSRAEQSELHVRCWDLDLIVLKNEWILLKEESTVVQKFCDSYFQAHPNGTVVFWENLDRIVPGEHVDDEAYQLAFLDYASAVETHIAEVFADFMSGKDKIKFSLNGRLIEPWDPFMTHNSFSTELPKESFLIHGHEVIIRPYILPHRNKMSAEEYIKYAGKNGWIEQQGFYLYRNHRLLVAGDWLLPGLSKKEQYKLARIRIDIGNELDKEWSIDVKKSRAVPPVSIQSEIKRIALAAQKQSAQIYKHRGKRLMRSSEKNQTYFWHQRIRDGKIGYEINRNHPFVKKLLDSDMKTDIKRLLDMLEETIPVPAIISDYSEKGDEMLNPFEGRSIADIQGVMEEVYTAYLSTGLSQEEAIRTIASTEPFMYKPDEVELFKEKKEKNHG